MSVQHYQINVPQATLDDLKRRLARTRWTDEAPQADWNYGTNLSYMRELAAYWQNHFDWRKEEARLNEFHWFTAHIDGEDFRFIHERGKGPNPTPIILFHGWPDSFYRYLKVIPLLTDPAAHGGNANESFDVIIPDLIADTRDGKAPVRAQMMKQTAERAWKLMTQELGYERFLAGGGDGGSPISQVLGVDHPDSIIGLHLTDNGYSAAMAQYDDLSEAEQQYLQALQGSGFQEGAYAVLQGTKPQSLAYSLNDSPVGLAAWIIEKIRTWSDCKGDLESVYTKDELLGNIMQYWIKGLDPRGYREEWTNGSLAPNQQLDVPVGMAQPPNDVNPVTPREFAQRNLKNIQRWTVLPQGGHFVAMEFPEPFVEDLRAFARDLRT